jgi:5-formyltetrahydrofolate cyclo-ligase
MTVPIHQYKTSLRADVRARLAALTERQVRSRSALVCQRLGAAPAFVKARELLVYVSTGHEVSTHALIREMLASGRRVSVPFYHTVARRYVAYRILDFDADLAPGSFGILEPRPEPRHATPFDRFDAVLVPGLAFDAAGHRLGRGMGYFDHILSDTRGARIGLAYDLQIIPEVPADAHDMHMDFIVTESNLIDCRG